MEWCGFYNELSPCLAFGWSTLLWGLVYSLVAGTFYAIILKALGGKSNS